MGLLPLRGITGNSRRPGGEVNSWLFIDSVVRIVRIVSTLSDAFNPEATLVLLPPLQPPLL